MTGYGVISSLCYLISVVVHNRLNTQLKQKNTLSEGVFVFCFILINFAPTYAYYRSDLVVGEYSFQDFVFQLYLASVVIIVPLIIVGRWAITRMKPAPTVSNKITYVGENKLDVLQLEKVDLLLVQTANNYVEFHYLQSQEARKKMIRSTLTKVHEEIPELVRVHRSYLVNFDHFVQWEDKKHIMIHGLKIPVSDKYRQAVLALSKTQP